MQQSIKGLLCSLLYQLVENSAAATNHVFQHTCGRSSGAKDAHTDWSVPELRSIFLQTLSSYERPVLIVIDGLDEVHPAEGPLELLDLVEQFPRCRNTKLCLASRPEPILKERLSVYPHLRLQDLTRADMDRYARDHIKLSGIIGDEDVSNSSMASNTPWNPIESIVYKAEGVFLWLVLAIRNINTGYVYGDTPAIIQQRIDNLPGDLTKLYTDMWNRACEDSPEAYRETAALYFRLVLLERQTYIDQRLPRLSLLQLMLASTSIADEILDAIENPLNLVPEGRILRECRELERKVNLYCFGLVTFSESIGGPKAVGWYGSQYDGLWSRYGRRYPEFIHRTARDFLLDTFEGRNILSYGNSSESWLLSRWFKAQLASSQLYVDTRSIGVRNAVINRAKMWVYFVYHRIEDFGPCDPNWTQAIFYLERLCSSGQMFAGTLDNAKFCGGLDFLKAAALICCHESIWSASKMRNLSTEVISEIFLNLCGQGRMLFKPWHGPFQDAIDTLIHEGAQPDWRGTVFTPSMFYEYEYSEMQTPFTLYLKEALRMTSKRMRPEQYRMNEVLRNLHDFLCRSAHLEDMLAVSFWHRHSSDGCIHTYTMMDLETTCGTLYGPAGADQIDSVVVSLSAYTALQALLDSVREEFEHPRCKEEESDVLVIPIIASIQKRLDSCSRPNEDCIIGRVVHEYIIKDTKGEYSRQRKPVWYMPSKKEPAGIAGELVKELGRGLVVEDNPSSTGRCRIVSQLVQQMSWTLQAEGFDDIWASLAKLGLLARVDYEQHDMQYWVDKFQEQKSADGRFADGVKVAQCYIRSPST